MSSPADFSLLIRSSNYNIDNKTVVPLPITMKPSSISLENKTKAIKLQLLFNILTHSLSTNWAVLDRILSPIKDSFIRSLYKRWTSIRNEIPKDKIHAYILRSDYMIDKEEDRLCQVELNTISVAFPYLSQQIHSFHRLTSLQVEPNPLCEELCSSFAQMVNLFNERMSFTSSITLMVIVEGERNTYDQEGIVACLLEKHGITMKRSTLEEAGIYFKKESNIPYIHDKPLSLVYYRSCYSPETSNPEMDPLRKKIEVSETISIPSMSCHLSGMKIVQEKLATDEGLLEELFSSFIPLENDLQQAITLVKSCFVQMHPGTWSPSMPSDSWSNYVLKPQREGGGNNIFSSSIPTHLDCIDRTEYTVQRLILPSFEDNVLVSSDSSKLNTKCSAEFGFFGGMIVVDGAKTIVSNTFLGTLVRCKAEGQNEIGISSGFGYLSSLCLL